jgi:hypothetical protein
LLSGKIVDNTIDESGQLIKIISKSVATARKRCSG